MKTKITLLLIATATAANAIFVDIGDVQFSGTSRLTTFTTSTIRAAQPFGFLGDQTVVSSKGIFSPYISAGDVLPGRSLWTNGPNVPQLALGGFLFTTDSLLVAGADSGRFVGPLGLQLTGNGFSFPDPDNFASWGFTAPPYDISNFPQDITGPITLEFGATHDNHLVPDTGSTLMLLGIALLALPLWKLRRHCGANCAAKVW